MSITKEEYNRLKRLENHLFEAFFEKAVCPECNGRGSIQYVNFDGESIEFGCPMCRGTGYNENGLKPKAVRIRSVGRTKIQTENSIIVFPDKYKRDCRETWNRLTVEKKERPPPTCRHKRY